MSSRVLITGSRVVSLDPAAEVAVDADILVVDGTIAEIGPGLDGRDAEVVDGAGTIAVPGFVDTHRHTWEAIIRGMLPAQTIGDYFGSVLLGVGPAVRPEDMYAGNLIGAYEALNAGVTTIVDWTAINSPDHADAAIAALQEAGIRAMFGHGTPAGIEFLIDGSARHPADARRVKEQYFASDDQLLTFALALRGPTGLDPEANQHDFALARELGARITVHAGMRLPGMPNGEVQAMHDQGLLGPDMTVVHANETVDDELKLLVDAGASVSVAPYVELVMGHGHPPFARLRRHGIKPSLSMDCACTVPGDMFTQMRTALAFSHGEQQPASATDPFTPAESALDVLTWATTNGARACGLEDRIGSLEVGKQADIVLIRADAINTMPGSDPVATVVSSADVSNVDTVLVAGRAVKRHGQLVDVDLPRLRQLGAASNEFVLEAAAAAASAAAKAGGPPAG